ncbi:MAG TPA: hypothetical protein VJP80_00055 [Candidatus Saccharimonadales bacterium]|nr:hypothetical protein [Candidatus Saccharimonadales bacterium]
MRNAIKFLMVLTLLPLFIGLTACGANGNTGTDSSSLTLRTYTVPVSRAEDLSQTLNHLLRMDNGKRDVGSAWVAGPGQLLVLAPNQLQTSIADSLKQIVAHGQSAAASQPLRLNAWIVDAYPGNGPVDPSLKAIQPALAAFVEDIGPAHFVQAHYLTAVSDVGAHTDLIPFPHGELSYSIVSSEGGLTLNFDYHQLASNVVNGSFVRLQGRVTLAMGQTTVLGLVSDRPIDHAASSTHTNAGLIHTLLVVRITPANQS